MPSHRGWGRLAKNKCPHPDRKRDLTSPATRCGGGRRDVCMRQGETGEAEEGARALTRLPPQHIAFEFGDERLVRRFILWLQAG